MRRVGGRDRDPQPLTGLAPNPTHAAQPRRVHGASNPESEPRDAPRFRRAGRVQSTRRRRRTAVFAAGVDLAKLVKQARQVGVAETGRTLSRGDLEAVGRMFLDLDPDGFRHELKPSGTVSHAQWKRHLEQANQLWFLTLWPETLGLERGDAWTPFDTAQMHDLRTELPRYLAGGTFWWVELAGQEPHVHAVTHDFDFALELLDPDGIREVCDLKRLIGYSRKSRSPRTFEALGRTLVARAIASESGIRLPANSGAFGFHHRALFGV